MIASFWRSFSAPTAGRTGARRGLVASLLGQIAAIWRTSRDRQILARLPDSMLSDIGLSRSDIERELARPAWSSIDYAQLEAARHHAARHTPAVRRPR